MNTLAAVGLFGLFLLILLIAVRLSIALLRAGVPAWLAVLATLLSVPAIAASGAFGISRFGERQQGTITGKSEVLEVSDQGLTPRVTHRLIVSVASAELARTQQSLASKNLLFKRVRRAADLDFDVNENRYDALKLGDTVALREFRWGGLQIARFEDEPWWNIAPGRFERFLPNWHPGSIDVSATARITSVRTVHEAREVSLLASSADGGVRTALRQPYDEVGIQFLTGNGAQILTLDRIDSGSAGQLEPGMAVLVHYPSYRPRSARLTAGRRDFEARNALEYWGENVAGFLAAMAITVIAFWLVRRYRSAVRLPLHSRKSR